MEESYEDMPYEELQDIYQEVLSVFRKGEDEDSNRLKKMYAATQEKQALWRSNLAVLSKQIESTSYNESLFNFHDDY